MEQVIYADVLFAVNFSMDFLSLYLTGKVFRARMRPVPLTLAAGIGALYGTASLFLGPGGRINLSIHPCGKAETDH